jgi:hypothetical protein
MILMIIILFIIINLLIIVILMGHKSKFLKSFKMLYLIISFNLLFCKIFLNLISFFEIFVGSHEKLQGK